MKNIRKGTIAIDRSVIGTGRLVLVKNPIHASIECKVRSFTGTIRFVKKGFLTVLIQAPEKTKTVTEAINSQPRKIIKRLLEKL